MIRTQTQVIGKGVKRKSQEEAVGLGQERGEDQGLGGHAPGLSDLDLGTTGEAGLEKGKLVVTEDLDQETEDQRNIIGNVLLTLIVEMVVFKGQVEAETDQEVEVAALEAELDSQTLLLHLSLALDRRSS